MCEMKSRSKGCITALSDSETTVDSALHSHKSHARLFVWGRFKVPETFGLPTLPAVEVHSRRRQKHRALTALSKVELEQSATTIGRVTGVRRKEVLSSARI